MDRTVFGRLVSALFLVASLLLTRTASADIAAFDLTGPSIDIKIQRAGKTLPISQVPNLQSGDRIWIHPALPPNQSVHYLLVAAFLRGATNPPPDRWFTRAETWSRKVREEGIFVTVPATAEQAVIFLAPETNGDFSTLRSAVRGRPGSFVRAIQDLEQASLDRSRLDTYLAAMHKAGETDPAKVHGQSLLLARSLTIHLEEDCFKKPLEQQAACLTQRSDNLVLSDGHSQSMVGALTQGHAADLIGQITYTPTAGSGYFSPYVGAIVDMARILDSLHTAQYQYIPALGLPKQDQLELKLNTPPSFHNPKSVIVVALPAIRSVSPPPLRALDPKQASCLQNSPLVLPVAGAPLAFSTGYLHDMTLRLESKGGPVIDLPAQADAVRGGYVIDTQALAGKQPDQIASEGVLQGYWGFDPFKGPSFKLQKSHAVSWAILLPETSSLLAGHEHTFNLHADPAACVNRVAIKDPQGNELKANWKMTRPDELEVKLAAGSAKPGTLTMVVAQKGLPQPDEVKIGIYAETSHLERFAIIPGERQAILHGSRLEEVADIEVDGVHFTPSAASFHASTDGQGEMPFAAESGEATASLHSDAELMAHVVLKDGRKLEAPATVESPRPGVALLSKRVEPGAVSTASAIQLTDPDELPLDGRLAFSLKAVVPNVFPRGEKIEISASDDLHVTLSIADGTLTLQDPGTVLATFDPLKSFGKSAFGPLRFRPVDERGVQGDWQPLATLIRVPSLKELQCTEDPAQQCTLSGTSLFLLERVGTDEQFAESVRVPQGFVDSVLKVPHPVAEALYVTLRDNPKAVHTAMVPITITPVPAEKPAQ